MSDITVSKDGWTGFLVPERIASIKASASDEPIVGPAEPSASNTGTGVLKTVYTRRTSPSDDYNVVVSRGGSANSDSLPAELVLSQEFDSGTYYLGHMDPTVVWGHEYIGSYQYSRVCRWGGYQGWTLGPVYSHLLPDIAIVHDICSGPENQVVVVAMSRFPFNNLDNTIIETSIYDRTVSEGTAVSKTFQVIPTDVFDLSHGLVRVRVGYSNGTCLLLATFNQDSQYRVHQWASGDVGRSWKYIGSTADTVDDFGFSVVDIEGTESGFYVALACEDDSTSKSFRLLRVVSPYQTVWSAPYVDVGTTGWGGTASPTSIESSLTSAETGEIYFLLLSNAGAGNFHVGQTFVSPDLGENWKQLIDPTAFGYWMRMPVNTATRPSLTDCVYTNGLVLFTSYFNISATARRYSLALGGWSNHAPTTSTYGSGFPVRAALGDEEANATVGWSQKWLPWKHLPTDWGFSAGETGATTATLDHLGLNFTGGATPAEGRTYFQNIDVDSVDIHTHRFRIVCETDVETSSDHHRAPIVVTVRSCDNPAGSCYGLIFAIDASNVRVYKKTTGSPDLINTHQFDTSGGSEFYIYASIDVSTAVASYRISQTELTSYTGSSTILGLRGKLLGWNTANGTTTSMADILSVSTTSSVEWGSWLATGETATVYEFFHSEDLGGQAPASPSGSRPNTQGRQLLGNLLYMGKDIIVSPLGGIFNTGDSWTVADDYEYSAQHVVSPDPGLIWRVTNETEQSITARFNFIHGPIIGILLKGLRHEGFLTVSLFDSEDGWTNYIDEVAPPAALVGIMADSKGNTLRPGTGIGEVNTYMFRENEFAGSWVSFGEVRRVLSNAGGRWDPDSVSTTPTIRLEDFDDVDNDLVEIYPQDVLILINIGQKVIGGVRIGFPVGAETWPAGEAYYQMQRMLVGQVLVCGDDPDWQRSIRHDVGVEAAELPSGRVRPKQKLPMRRTAEVSWTDGIDTTRAVRKTGEPFYFGGDLPWADVGSTPWMLQGLLERVNGEAGEVVYIPRRPNFTDLESQGDFELLLRRHQFLHGRITSSVSHDVVQGEEDSNEVIRVGTITIREEV